MTSIPADVMAKIGHRIQTAPVDVSGVAEDLGLAIFESDLAPGVSGALVRDASYETQSGFVIFVNAGEAHVRQRFTAAHEIAHFVLHQDKIGQRIEDNYMLRSNGLTTTVERQANRFAADLLMPDELVQRLVQEGVATVDGLASRLQVSQVAMAIRLGHPT